MKNRDKEKHINLRIPNDLHKKMEKTIAKRYLQCSKNHFILTALDWYIELERNSLYNRISLKKNDYTGFFE